MIKILILIGLNILCLLSKTGIGFSSIIAGTIGYFLLRKKSWQAIIISYVIFSIPIIFLYVMTNSISIFEIIRDSVFAILPIISGIVFGIILRYIFKKEKTILNLIVKILVGIVLILLLFLIFINLMFFSINPLDQIITSKISIEYVNKEHSERNLVLKGNYHDFKSGYYMSIFKDKNTDKDILEVGCDFDDGRIKFVYDIENDKNIINIYD